MRRKSERTNKKPRSSPEKKVENPKRTRTSRRKRNSSSSANESTGDNSPPRDTVETEKKSPTKQAAPKDDSPEGNKVWEVKTTETPGEIQKLKICLARSASTPERVDKSPRSKRKHSHTTSSSDSPSVDVIEEKKKRHRSKRGAKEKDDSDKNDSQGSEPDREQIESADDSGTQDKANSACTSMTEDNVPMSTTSDEPEKPSSVVEEPELEHVSIVQEDHAVEATPTQETVDDTKQTLIAADTTVDSSMIDSSAVEVVVDMQVDKGTVVELTIDSESNEPAETIDDTLDSKIEQNSSKNELLSAVPESNEAEPSAQQTFDVGNNENTNSSEVINDTLESKDLQESISSKTVREDTEILQKSHQNNVDSSPNERKREHSVTPDKEPHVSDSQETHQNKDYNRSDSVQSKEELLQNGQSAPLLINRKRKWGSRPNKITTQKSITISTDILKDIIPDVKPVEFDEVIEERKHKKESERLDRPILPKIVIDNTEHVDYQKRNLQADNDETDVKVKEPLPLSNRKISIVSDHDSVLTRPPSPPRHKSSSILFITNLVRPFTLPQLKNLLQRTGRIVEDGFWIDRIKSRCYVVYENEDQATETRHALHGVTWPVSNPKTLQVDFSTREAFEKAKLSEENSETPTTTIPGTVEDWLREQDSRREKVDMDKSWEKKNIVREWDVGKGEKEKERMRREEQRPLDKRRHRTPERSPEPAKKFKKKEEETPAKLLDDLFNKTKTTPCIYWLPLSAETIAVKEEQRRQHMAEHERRMHELRRHRRH